MNEYHFENLGVLGIGIAIGFVGAVFGESGHILRHGAGIALAGLFTIKGVTRLRCKISDVVLAAIALCLFALSKGVPFKTLSPLVFECATLTVLLLYVATGLTYRSILADQRNRKKS